MSNIQITENGSGKYSPEWFYSESQTPEWISFAHKADELRENFINLFGIERLKSLFGKDLLTSLFYNDEGTKTNLCYRLEMDKDIREVFGSISGGAAYKFGLFYHKKNQSWTCGSPLKPIHLTEDEAIQKAEEMRNDLVEGAEIISSFGPLDSEKDYEQLYKQLEHIPGINMVWRMKYYQMLFPTLFAPFYGQDIQLRVLHFLNQKPSDIPFIRMGQISLYARKCNVPGVVFAHIYGKNVGYTNETNDSDTNTLSDKKHKTHYWMYTVFDDKSWNECQQKGIMVLGMDDIGDYSQFASKEALRQELIDVYDSSTSRKNQALMAWNFANTVSVNDVIFAKRSNTLLGKGIVTGNYVFDDLRQEYKNVRAIKWLQVGEWEHPGNAVAKRLTDITPYTDFQALQAQNYKDLATEKFHNTAELCAAILDKGISVQLKRGLGRDYLPKSESLSTLQGKLNISESIKTQTLLKKQMICTYDEFSTNTQFNQIIKSTMLLLLKANITNTRKKSLRNLLLFFSDVNEIDLRFVNWNQHYNRSNQSYQMLIGICYLIYNGLLQTQNDGTSKIMDFFDEQRMCRLYEKFLLEYYRKEHPELSANASQIAWQLDDSENQLLPKMQTDIMLSQRNNILIIDAKYYSHMTQQQYGTNTLHSNNLYQIFTYVKNKEFELKDCEHTVSGMLLYAQTDENIISNNTYQMSGNQIAVRALNLNQDFSRIAEDLDSIIEKHFFYHSGE